jgi:hypothetical protein
MSECQHRLDRGGSDRTVNVAFRSPKAQADRCPSGGSSSTLCWEKHQVLDRHRPNPSGIEVASSLTLVQMHDRRLRSLQGSPHLIWSAVAGLVRTAVWLSKYYCKNHPWLLLPMCMGVDRRCHCIRGLSWFLGSHTGKDRNVVCVRGGGFFVFGFGVCWGLG